MGYVPPYALHLVTLLALMVHPLHWFQSLASHSQMVDRRSKVLCYNCDEKFTLGHRCKTLHYYIVYDLAEKDSGDLPEATPENVPTLETTFEMRSLLRILRVIILPRLCE